MRDLFVKIKNLIKRAYVSKVLDDSKNYPVTRVSYLNKEGLSEVLSPYGLSVSLPANTPVLLFSVYGDEANRLCIGYSEKDRFKNLQEGEVVVGNPKTLAYIKFNAERDIEIEVPRDLNVNSERDINVEAKRNIKVIVGRDMDIDISGGRDFNMSIDRDMNVTVDRDVNLTVDGDINIFNANDVNVDANQVNLGVGGQPIARVGDSVQVSLTTGIGTITSGGNNTSI